MAITFDDILDTGSDILDAVSDAIEKNDYSNLADSIKASAAHVMDQAGPMPGGTRRTYSSQGTPPDFYSSRYEQRTRSEQGRSERRENQTPRGHVHYGMHTTYSSGKAPFASKNLPALPGVGQIAGGTVGTVMGGLLAGTFGVLAATISAGFAIGAALGGALAAGGIGLILGGRKQKALVDTYKEYADIVGDAEYVEVKEIAEKTGTDKAGVVKNLEEMIKKDMVPRGWFDPGKTTLMLTDNAHNQYLQAEASRKEREERERQELGAYGNLPPEVQKLLKDGDAWRKTIRDYNDRIPGIVMSEKLDRLEAIMDQIFTRVKNEPGTAGRLRKLMNYYLPTTEKLLKAYVELEGQGDESSRKAQAEIEETFDTIIEAFENLFASLFEEMQWDISSDITVMKNMMKQDGLLEE